jgi:hypothetical protein
MKAARIDEQAQTELLDGCSLGGAELCADIQMPRLSSSRLQRVSWNKTQADGSYQLKSDFYVQLYLCSISESQIFLVCNILTSNIMSQVCLSL